MWRLVIAAMLVTSSLYGAELSNCEKADAYFKASKCAKAWAHCDKDGNVYDPPMNCPSGSTLCSWVGASMPSSVVDQMEINSQKLRADGLAYQALCNAEKNKAQ